MLLPTVVSLQVALLATATANSLQGDGLQPWPRSAPGRALLALLPLLIVLGAARLPAGHRPAPGRWRVWPRGSPC